MFRRTLLIFLCIAAPLTSARDKTETWLRISSPHFVVVTNASEKQGRHVADQFERMRSVFHAAFPKLQIDSGVPIIVLAIKDEKEFKALEPQAYLAKGALRLGGLFLRVPDKNYVLMRLDAEGEHPYEVIYHEYTHLLLSKAAEWMPLWLNEGLAEFYQNSEIRDKDVTLGGPSAENLALLRQNRLLPLATLFTVDEKSPYYHEENKGSIFYAESWALTEYILLKDFEDKTSRFSQYVDLMAQNVDSIEAATRVYGDLKQLQLALERNIQRGAFTYFKGRTTTEVDDSAFKVQAMSEVQADAVLADFLAYNERTADAQVLLDHILQEDPKNVSAQETLGFMEFRKGDIDGARSRYAQAVQLDSQSYLAHYYFAAMSMNGRISASDEAQVEGSLRTAIKLNPSFAPAYDRLAAFLGMRQRNLDEAHMMGLTAVSLEPANVGYRIDVANILLEMGQVQNAVNVLNFAVKLARTPQETQALDRMLRNAQAYAASQARNKDRTGADTEAGQEKVASASEIPHLSHRKDFVPNGPHRFVLGVLKSIHCDPPNMDLTVASGTKTLTLHSDNYYKIQFTALNFEPSGDLKPCDDLENRTAKVEYVESADPKVTAQLISVELRK